MKTIFLTAIAALWAFPGIAAQNGGQATLPADASLSEYVYIAPRGWTVGTYVNVISLASPVYSTGEKCLIEMWPMTPSVGDLMMDASTAWARIFRGFAVRPLMSPAPPLFRGTAAQGWEYLMIKQGIAFAGSAGDPRQEQQLFGFVMIAKMGSRVAAVSGVSKDPLVSSCFGSVLENVWPRFFSTLQFRNWTPPPGAGLSQKIVGVWESFGSSIGGGAVVRYVFTAAGRYAEAGTMQRYMALSRYETAIWTSRTFGDGSYTIRGNELVLTPDSGQPEVSRVRLEQSSQDGGRTWVEKLFLLKASMTSGNCSQFRCSNDDIELALERRDP